MFVHYVHHDAMMPSLTSLHVSPREQLLDLTIYDFRGPCDDDDDNTNLHYR